VSCYCWGIGDDGLEDGIIDDPPPLQFRPRGRAVVQGRRTCPRGLEAPPQVRRVRRDIRRFPKNPRNWANGSSWLARAAAKARASDTQIGGLDPATFVGAQKRTGAGVDSEACGCSTIRTGTCGGLRFFDRDYGLMADTKMSVVKFHSGRTPLSCLKLAKGKLGCTTRWADPGSFPPQGRVPVLQDGPQGGGGHGEGGSQKELRRNSSDVSMVRAFGPLSRRTGAEAVLDSRWTRSNKNGGLRRDRAGWGKNHRLALEGRGARGSDRPLGPYPASGALLKARRPASGRSSELGWFCVDGRAWVKVEKTSAGD